MKCLACGNEALAAGTLLETSGGGSVAFKLDAVSNWKSILGIGTRKIRAHACMHCHHLQFSVDFTEKDLRKYQQFEGEQPSVLERINSELEK
jgi:hypothetical protein